MLSNVQRKQLRAIGHGLNPVVMVADKGLSEGVMAEMERALSDHELIKVRPARQKNSAANGKHRFPN